MNCQDCGHVAGDKLHFCQECSVKFCFNCSNRHKTPIKCRLATMVRELEGKIQLIDLDEHQMKNLMLNYKYCSDEIDAMIIEAHKLCDSLTEVIRKITANLTASLQNKLPPVTKRREELEKVSKVNALLTESKQIVMNDNIDDSTLRLDMIKLSEMLNIISDPQLFQEPKSLLNDEENLSKLYEIKGLLTDYKEKGNLQVIKHHSGEFNNPSGIAYDPVEDLVYVIEDESRYKLRPDKTECEHVFSHLRWPVSLIHVTERGEELRLSENRLIRAGSEFMTWTINALKDEHIIALSSYNVVQGSLLYFLTPQKIFQAMLTYPDYLSETVKLLTEVELHDATDITVDKHGNVYVTDSNAVLVFNKVSDTEARLYKKIGESFNDMRLERPLSLCFDIFGYLLVADAASGCVHVYDDGLRYYCSVQDEMRPTYAPRRIAVNRLRQIYVLDAARNQILAC